MRDEFTSWLQSELDKRNWSLGEAGRQADIEKSTFHYYLNGREPTFERIVQLADLFEIDPERICRMLLSRYR